MGYIKNLTCQDRVLKINLKFSFCYRLMVAKDLGKSVNVIFRSLAKSIDLFMFQFRVWQLLQLLQFLNTRNLVKRSSAVNIVDKGLSTLLLISVRNSPRQSANAEVFAEAYLHFIVFASAIKMPRQLNR